MACIDFVGPLHNRTKRDYVARVTAHDKAACMEIAKAYGRDYWDGERQYGYGGYRYDGRWLPIAQAMARHYGLKAGDRILDVCCGKGFLLHEFMQAVPGVEVAGIDISQYAIDNAKEEVKPFLRVGNAVSLPWADQSFDFVVSLGGLHNLPIRHLFDGVREIERVGKGAAKYIMVESWRTERERMNLLYWQLTCESYHDVENWEWIYEQCGYRGDWGFIFFE
ncbi:MAG: class I SAM-dependent methyltransferase [Reyranellaceae bacterium]